MKLKLRRVTRTPTSCPTCGGPARAAYVRSVKKPGESSGRFEPIGRVYCAKCDKLLARE